jgi:hypothetical protein
MHGHRHIRRVQTAQSCNSRKKMNHPMSECFLLSACPCSRFFTHTSLLFSAVHMDQECGWTGVAAGTDTVRQPVLGPRSPESAIEPHPFGSPVVDSKPPAPVLAFSPPGSLVLGSELHSYNSTSSSSSSFHPDFGLWKSSRDGEGMERKACKNRTPKLDEKKSEVVEDIDSPPRTGRR